MDERVTIFQNKVRAAKPKSYRDKSGQHKERKKRSDALKDIKFKLSNTDKNALQLLAIEHDVSLTAIASMIVKQEMYKISSLFAYEYDHNGEFVHVTLNNDDFKTVRLLGSELGLNIRQTVHRIVMNHISVDVIINDYRRNMN